MTEPKLRFAKYKNTWEKHLVKELFDRVGEPVQLEENVEYQEIGIRSHGKGLFHKEKTTAKEIGNKRVFWIEPGCFIVNIVFAWERAVAKTTTREVGMIASHRFPMYKPKSDKLDLDYITQYFTTKRGQNILILASPGGAGRNKTLGQKEFAESSIRIPSLEEQKAISKTIKSVEKVVDFISEDVRLWEEKKKGIMQKLFSQEVRFKDEDGNEYPNWEEHELNHYLYENTEKNKFNKYGKEDVLSVSKDYGVVNQIEYLGKSMSGEDLTNYRCVALGDIVYTKSPLGEQPYGIIKNSNMDGIVSVLYAVYHCRENADPRFIGQYFSNTIVLNNYLKPLVNIGAKHTMNVSNKTAISGVVQFPCLAEQQKIADCLTSIDEVIALKKQKLETWKNIKKGLLQQMFV